MTSKQFLSNLLLTAFVGLVLVAPVNAQSYGSYGCTGNCVTPNDLTINKQVQNPVSGVWVENLAPTDPTFAANSTALFKLIVTNTSGETMNPVTVTDKLPDNYMTWAGGDGSFDAASNKVTINAGQMVAGASQEFKILAKVVDAGKLPSGKNLFCVVNSAHVSSPARPNGTDDTAQVCIQTGVLGVTTLPVAGVNDWLLVAAFAAVGTMGLLFLAKPQFIGGQIRK